MVSRGDGPFGPTSVVVGRGAAPRARRRREPLAVGRQTERQDRARGVEVDHRCAAQPGGPAEHAPVLAAGVDRAGGGDLDVVDRAAVGLGRARRDEQRTPQPDPAVVANADQPFVGGRHDGADHPVVRVGLRRGPTGEVSRPEDPGGGRADNPGADHGHAHDAAAGAPLRCGGCRGRRLRDAHGPSSDPVTRTSPASRKDVVPARCGPR